ncbi:MAG: AAA family ATPase [Actinomycetota bacterium]
MSGPTPTLPFDAVVGQEEAKLALRLVAVDPLIGGVLLRGDKGSAKTTLARGLASLLDDAPFVDLPLGATEDRLIGSIDVTTALTEGEVTFRPGLLAEADGGVLYVDEVNLLADHLVDTLLDVAASGVNRVERDGVAHRHSSRFVLVGSMNPEEGELRPQLLDRFGLCVDVRAPLDAAVRAEIVRRRLAFDAEDGPAQAPAPADPASAQASDAGASLAECRPGSVPEDVIEAASALALAVGVEGLRADIVLCRAAAANATLEGRAEASIDDLVAVAPLVLAHRGRRSPFDPPEADRRRLQDALDDLDRPDQEPEPSPPDDGTPDGPDTADAETEADCDDTDAADDNEADGTVDGPQASVPMPIGPSRQLERFRSTHIEADRGRFVRDVALDERPDRPVSVVASVRRAATRRRGAVSSAPVDVGDLRTAVRERPRSRLIVMVVDTSGSMGAVERAEGASGAVLGLLADAYQQRDEVCLITVAGEGAEVVLPPTGSVEVARRRLERLRTGGQTPLHAGLAEARRIATAPAVARDEGRRPFVVVLTDGRATGAPDALDRALAEGTLLAAAGVDGLVLDCESGTPRLGLARTLAEAMGADYAPVADLQPSTIHRQVSHHDDR